VTRRGKAILTDGTDNPRHSQVIQRNKIPDIHRRCLGSVDIDDRMHMAVDQSEPQHRPAGGPHQDQRGCRRNECVRCIAAVTRCNRPRFHCRPRSPSEPRHRPGTAPSVRHLRPAPTVARPTTAAQIRRVMRQIRPQTQRDDVIHRCGNPSALRATNRAVRIAPQDLRANPTPRTTTPAVMLRRHATPGVPQESTA
jgi:hypothetical protein